MIKSPRITFHNNKVTNIILSLQGQMQVFEETGDALFLGSPRLESLSACKSVYLGDLEAHDTTKNQLVSSSLRYFVFEFVLGF